MREIVHLQAGQCGNQIGAKVSKNIKHAIMARFQRFIDLLKYLSHLDIHSFKYLLKDTY